MAKHQQLSTLSLLGIFVTIVGLALTLYAISQSTEFRQRASEGAILYITSTPEAAPKGTNITVSLDVSTNSLPIKSATVILTYPQTKLQIEKIDFRKSSFDIEGEQVAQNGYIRISRDASYPINGKSHIATIHFLTRDSVDLNDIKPVNGTAIMSTEDKNIYTNAVARNEEVTQSTQFFSIQFFFQFFRNLFSII